MLLAYSLLGGSALVIMRQDVREQTIPLWGIGLFAMASLLHQLGEPDRQGLWISGAIAGIFTACQGVFYLFKRKKVMGWGDVALSPFCGFWLRVSELPAFFIATGVFALLIGVFWRCKWKMRRFPLAPALFFGLGFLLLMRCFLMMNRV